MHLIIFDIDGTLADTKSVEDKCFIESFEHSFGTNLNIDSWNNFKHVTDWGITEELIDSQLGKKATKSDFIKMIQCFKSSLEKEKRINPFGFLEVPGARSFLEDINKLQQVKIGIATGSWEESARIKLSAIGINPDQYAFANSNHFKSRECILSYAIQQLKSRCENRPKSLTYFGDGIWDYKTCQNLNINFVGIDILNDNVLKDQGAKTVFNNYLNKEEILKSVMI